VTGGVDTAALGDDDDDDNDEGKSVTRRARASGKTECQ
jgi:hypothetical protein